VTTWILIFFATFDASSQAAVRVGFNSNESCAAAARELQAKFKPGTEVTWACVKQ
jgi:hypothetical protein